MNYITELDVIEQNNDNWQSLEKNGYQVVRNKYGEAQDFNLGAGGKYIYILSKSASSGKGIAAITFSSSKVKPGWETIPVDLNSGAGGDYIYLSFLQNSCADYITTLQSGYSAKSGDEGIGRAFDDFNNGAMVIKQDLNSGASGDYIYLGYYF